MVVRKSTRPLSSPSKKEVPQQRSISSEKQSEEGKEMTKEEADHTQTETKQGHPQEGKEEVQKESVNPSKRNKGTFVTMKAADAVDKSSDEVMTQSMAATRGEEKETPRRSLKRKAADQLDRGQETTMMEGTTLEKKDSMKGSKSQPAPIKSSPTKKRRRTEVEQLEIVDVQQPRTRRTRSEGRSDASREKSKISEEKQEGKYGEESKKMPPRVKMLAKKSKTRMLPLEHFPFISAEAKATFAGVVQKKNVIKERALTMTDPQYSSRNKRHRRKYEMEQPV